MESFDQAQDFAPSNPRHVGSREGDARTLMRAAGASSDTVHEIPYRTVGGRTLLLHVSPPLEPSASPAPTAVFYHGGGWERGTWRQFQPQAARLNELGMLTVLVDYRTEGPVAATADAVAAMNAVFERSRDIGCDAERVVAIGGSAGGHLALATAVLDLPGTDDRHRPAALVLFNPVTDTTGDFPAGFGRRHFENDENARRYSPMHHVDNGTPPLLIMHGTADTAVHHDNSVALVNTAKQLGAHAEIVLYPGQRHGFFNPAGAASGRAGDDGNSYFEITTEEMIGFIRRMVIQGR